MIYELSATTNRTLLDDEKKACFEEHKDHMSLVMSVDGAENMQETNHSADIQFEALIQNIQATHPVNQKE